ncbi:hypothetical protein ACFSSA_09760 [Luteolibacter algae]|uniref:Tetratricopeptide repeat protein n=1 Tax=Luteolibacter algae TaxID=454151 RepID=A0ABW5D7W3_9BACT
MRIPFFAAIPLCLITAFAIWWTGTKDIDFLTPPSEAKLEEIRLEAQASLPPNKIVDDAISIVIQPPTDKEEPSVNEPADILEPVDVGDISSPPTLDTYSERAPEGADKLLALAAALESQGAFQRALLAYERVLDLSQANPEQIQSALLSIRRVRPTLTLWNNDPEQKQPVIIHIGTGAKFSDILPDVMTDITKKLNIASSGLLDFSFKLNIGKSIQTTDAPTPVALWITGEGKSPSTDVLSFTSDDPETLTQDLMKTIFNLVRGHLTKSTSYNPAPEALEDPLPALESNITRLLWYEFGAHLNTK